MGTARTNLPFLVPGQMQKEFFHNEALQTIDMLLHPVVASVGLAEAPAAPIVGESHIVGANPLGAWAGHSHHLATFTEGGWRFVTPFEGMIVGLSGTGLKIGYRQNRWVEGPLEARSLHVGGRQVVGARQPAIADPSGGASPDPEARSALRLVLGALRQHGLIEG